MNNPYSPPSTVVELSRAGECKLDPHTLNRWLSIPVGLVMGGLVAGIVTALLAWAYSVTPLASRFPYLVYVSLPFTFVLKFSATLGMLSGGGLATFWSLSPKWRWRSAFLLSLCPALALFGYNTFTGEASLSTSERFVSSLVVFLVMVFATATSIRFCLLVFNRWASGGVQAPISKVGICLSCTAILFPLVLAMLSELGILSLSKNSNVPIVSLFGSLSLAMMGISVSIAARWKEGTRRSLVGILIGMIALPTGVFISWLFAMAGLA